MTTPDLNNQKLMTVATRPDEIQANQVVAMLEAAGIRANAVGLYTSAFRTEAPGNIQIQVLESNAEQARALIHQSDQ